MLYQIHEVAKKSGATVRALQYYDKLGLLRPTALTESGYRLYDDEALARLQEILFFRELEFSLAQIAEIVNAPGYDRTAALRRQRELLLAKRERLEGIIALVESTLKGENSMSFEAFDARALEAARAEYAAEAKARWGGTAAYAQSEARAAKRTPAQWQEMKAEMDEIFAAFAALRATDPSAPAAQEQVARWQAHISAQHYDCTKEILQGLGTMYSTDERFQKNLDAYGAGTAAFISQAIASYCK